jgi:hypothetical protein
LISGASVAFAISLCRIFFDFVRYYLYFSEGISAIDRPKIRSPTDMQECGGAKDGNKANQAGNKSVEEEAEIHQTGKRRYTAKDDARYAGTCDRHGHSVRADQVVVV